MLEVLDCGRLRAEVAAFLAERNQLNAAETNSLADRADYERRLAEFYSRLNAYLDRHGADLPTLRKPSFR